MELPESLRRHFATHFGFMADHEMVDSPDGPHAQRMRNLANATEITPEQAKEILGRCAGTLVLNRAALAARDRLSSERGVLVGLALFTGNPETVETAEQFMQEREARTQLLPHVEAAAHIARVLPYLIESQPQP